MADDRTALNAAEQLHSALDDLARKADDQAATRLGVADHAQVVTPLHLAVPAIKAGIATWARCAASRAAGAGTGTLPAGSAAAVTGRHLNGAAEAALEAHKAMRAAIQPGAAMTPARRPLITAARNAETAARAMPGLPFAHMSFQDDRIFSEHIMQVLACLETAFTREAQLISEAFRDAGRAEEGFFIAACLDAAARRASDARVPFRQLTSGYAAASA